MAVTRPREALWCSHHLTRHEGRSPIVLYRFMRKNLAKLYATLEYKKGAEIGVEGGRFSRQICVQNPGVELLAIDAWLRYPGYDRKLGQGQVDKLLEQARQRLQPYDATIIRAFSMDAVRDVAPDSLDFVYIDGNHRFDYVMQDIIEWSKRVRRGGIVSGHDYYHSRQVDVVAAVDAYVKAHGIGEWWLTGEQGSRSWFWVKQ